MFVVGVTKIDNFSGREIGWFGRRGVSLQVLGSGRKTPRRPRNDSLKERGILQGGSVRAYFHIVSLSDEVDAAVRRVDIDRHPGILPKELRKYGRQSKLNNLGRTQDAYSAAQFSVQALAGLLKVSDLLLDGTSMRNHEFACIGERKAARGAAQQPNPGRPLERGDALADRGCRDRENLRSGGETAAIHDVREQPQVVEIKPVPHVHLRSVRGMTPMPERDAENFEPESR
jgi:hypothetical protein